MNETERWIVETVERKGWAVMSVSPAAGSDDPEEWFTYSIGLPKTFDWPELICFGLDTRTMAMIVNDTVEECRQSGLQPAAGLRLSGVIDNYDILLVDGSGIPDSYLGSANWFADQSGRQQPVCRLQILWPDRDGFFPGDERCRPGVVAAQTPVEQE